MWIYQVHIQEWNLWTISLICLEKNNLNAQVCIYKKTQHGMVELAH